jgi:hypothetical protein
MSQLNGAPDMTIGNAWAAASPIPLSVMLAQAMVKRGRRSKFRV